MNRKDRQHPHAICLNTTFNIEFNVKLKNKVMKKKCNSGGLMKIRLRKTLLVMKFLCFFFLLSVSVSAASYSQNARFTLTLENVALTDVFSTIRKSSEFTFIYNMDDVRNIRVKSINVHEATIEEILNEVLRNTGFVY